MGTSLTVIDRELTARLPMFAQLLPPSVTPQRLMRTVIMSIERLPKLLECTPQSIMNAATTAAVLGLECDGVTGQGYIVPYKDRATFQIGYRGYNTIAARAGFTITGDVFREGDEFEYEKGTSAFLRHKAWMRGPQGRILGAWAVASRPGYTSIIEVMQIEEILAIKEKSPSSKKSDSPWNDFNGPGFAAMASKTVKRRLARSMPMSVMQQAAALDARQESDAPAWINEKGAIVDITPVAEATTPISDTSPAEILTPANGIAWPRFTTLKQWVTWSTDEFLPKATSEEALAWHRNFAAKVQMAEDLALDGKGKEALDAMLDLYDERIKP